MPVLSRLLEAPLRRCLDQFPAVVLEGARQVGKSTLARNLPHAYVSLDDVQSLAEARRDPDRFVRGLSVPVTIDEAQRVPDLMLAVKAAIDRDRRPGSFLLTGSANLSFLRKARESLAGRAALLRVFPMTASELAGDAAWNPLERLDACREAGEVLAAFRQGREFRIGEGVLAGGFPEPAHALPPAKRPGWFEAYRTLYVSRDVPELVRVEQMGDFLRLASLCAASTAQLVNLSRMARDVAVSVDTVRRWLNVLEATYLVERLQPYWRNTRSRLVRTPKLHVGDSGMAAHLLGVRDWADAGTRGVDGFLLETWVHQQLKAFAESPERQTGLYFFRSHGGPEVDLVMERGGRLIPVEVKRAATLRREDAAGLRAFLDLAGKDAPFGILLHGGGEAVSLGDRIVALPLRAFLAGPG